MQEEQPFPLNTQDLYLHFLSDPKELEQFNFEMKTLLLQSLVQPILLGSLVSRKHEIPRWSSMRRERIFSCSSKQILNTNSDFYNLMRSWKNTSFSVWQGQMKSDCK